MNESRFADPNSGLDWELRTHTSVHLQLNKQLLKEGTTRYPDVYFPVILGSMNVKIEGSLLHC